MTRNMGMADRAVRTLIALGIVVLYFTGKISGAVAIVLGVIAVAFLVTSFIGWCPSYLPFGLSTKSTADQKGTAGPPPR